MIVLNFVELQFMILLFNKNNYYNLIYNEVLFYYNISFIISKVYVRSPSIYFLFNILYFCYHHVIMTMLIFKLFVVTVCLQLHLCI